MTQIQVRQIEGDEALEVFYYLPSYAFSASPPFSDKAKYQEGIARRQGITYVALYEDGKAVACAASTPLTQNVRGTIYRGTGIFDVATLPEARRKGYSSRVMARLLAANRDQGRVVSCLYPFNEGFYSALGYTQLAQAWFAVVNPERLMPVAKLDLPGHVETCLMKDGYGAYCDFYGALQARSHGMVMFEHDHHARGLTENWWLAQAIVDGRTEGMLSYRLKGNVIMDFTMPCRGLGYTSQTAKYLLLGWIGRHANQATRAEIWSPTWEHPELWWPDLKVKLEPAFVAPMARVLDVARLGGMAVGTGAFSAKIVDATCPWNEGQWRFESTDGSLEVAPTNAADCEITIQALSALAYGTQDPDAFPMRGWGSVSPEVASEMRTLFPPREPYVFETF